MHPWEGGGNRNFPLEKRIIREDFDLIVIKSPGAYSRYFKFAKNYVVDTPGATSPNLKRLGHIKSPRPIFPLDENIILNSLQAYSLALWLFQPFLYLENNSLVAYQLE